MKPQKQQPPVHPVAHRLYELSQKIYAVNGSLPVLERGSAAWNAWREWRVQNGLPVDFMDRQLRWTVPTITPPVDLRETEKEWASKKKTRATAGTWDTIDDLP